MYQGGWVDVDSSWLQAVKYEAKSASLYVRFKDKAGNPTVTARYDGVDPATGFGLINAPSKGEYFHRSGLIKRRYVLV